MEIHNWLQTHQTTIKNDEHIEHIFNMYLLPDNIIIINPYEKIEKKLENEYKYNVTFEVFIQFLNKMYTTISQCSGHIKHYCENTYIHIFDTKHTEEEKIYHIQNRFGGLCSNRIDLPYYHNHNNKHVCYDIVHTINCHDEYEEIKLTIDIFGDKNIALKLFRYIITLPQINEIFLPFKHPWNYIESGIADNIYCTKTNEICNNKPNDANLLNCLIHLAKRDTKYIAKRAKIIIMILFRYNFVCDIINAAMNYMPFSRYITKNYAIEICGVYSVLHNEK